MIGAIAGLALNLIQSQMQKAEQEKAQREAEAQANAQQAVSNEQQKYANMAQGGTGQVPMQSAINPMPNQQNSQQNGFMKALPGLAGIAMNLFGGMK